MQKCNKYKKQKEKDQQIIKPFNKQYRMSLQDNLIDENDYNYRYKVFTKYLDETK